MAAVRLEPLDPTAPGIVMATMLADSAGVPHASALVSVGDAIQVEGDEAFLRCRPVAAFAQPRPAACPSPRPAVEMDLLAHGGCHALLRWRPRC